MPQPLHGTKYSYDDVVTMLDHSHEARCGTYLADPRDAILDDEIQFVRDIMWLYYLMKLAVNKEAFQAHGSSQDAAGRIRLDSMEPRFPGFDGEHQPTMLSYAKHLVSEGLFVEHDHDLDSHGSQPDYAAMLALWERWARPVELTPEQVETLLGR